MAAEDLVFVVLRALKDIENFNYLTTLASLALGVLGVLLGAVGVAIGLPSLCVAFLGPTLTALMCAIAASFTLLGVTIGWLFGRRHRAPP